MRNFFSLLCALTIVLSASAVPVKTVKLENAAKAPFALKKTLDLKTLAASDVAAKPAKAPKAVQDASISIAISNVTFNTAHVVVTPSDDEAYYIWNYAPAADLQGATDAQIANALVSYYIEYITEEYGESYVSMLLPYLFDSGVVEDDMEGLSPNTDYVFYAFYVDANGNLQGSVAKQAFKTESANVSKKEDLTLIGGEVYIYDFGAWQFWGEDANTIVSIAAYTETVAGSYKGSDLASYYTYIGKVAGADTTWYALVDADLTVAVSGTNAVISGTFIGQNEDDAEDLIEFTLSLAGTIVEEEQGKQYDEEDADFTHNFASYTIDDTYLASYGSVYVIAEEGTDYQLILDVTLAEGATVLMPGVYPVADEYDNQTVYAGFYDETYGFVPSYAATLVEQEGTLYFNEIWFLTEGNVTVNADGSIDVEAVNSYGRIIRSHLAAKAEEGIENIVLTEKAQKVVVDGAVYIVRDNKMFNLQGAQVR